MNQENKVWSLWWLPKLHLLQTFWFYYIFIVFIDMTRRGNKIKCLLSIFLFWPLLLFVSFQDSYWKQFYHREKRGVKIGPHTKCAASFHTHHLVLYCIARQWVMMTWLVQSCLCHRKEEDSGVSDVQKSPTP